MIRFIICVIVIIVFFTSWSSPPREAFCRSILKSNNRYSSEDVTECAKRVRHLDIGERIQAACLPLDFNSSAREEWRNFKTKFNKSYNVNEELYRCITFQDSLREIELHNRRYAAGKESYFLKVTEVADMTVEEVRLQYLGDGGVYALKDVLSAVSPTLPKFTDNPPDYIDWYSRGYVTESIDQNVCQACWAFAAVGVVEGQYFERYKVLKRLSVQQVIDCTYSDRNGCRGGSTMLAFYYIKHLGIVSAEDYPYTRKSGQCKNKKWVDVTFINASYVIPPYDEELMKRVVATIGPIGMVFYMPPEMRLYGGGVYNADVCPKNKGKINHAVVLVGYGVTERKEKYWLIKNSMGKNWGENGFFKLPRGSTYCSVGVLTGFATI